MSESSWARLLRRFAAVPWGWGALIALLVAGGWAYTERLRLAEFYLRRVYPEAFGFVPADLPSDVHLQRALVAFACAGATDKVKLLHMLGRDLPLWDMPIRDALICAVREGRTETAMYLIAKRGDLNAVRPRMSYDSPYLAQTALQEAVQDGSPQMLDMLLRAGADPNVVTDFGTALNVAAYRRDPEMVRRLLAGGARLDVMAQEPAIFSWAQGARVGAKWRESIAAAESVGLPLAAKDKRGRSLLHWAASRGEVELVQLLVEKGLSRRDADANGALPFMHLVYRAAVASRTETPGLRAALLLLMEDVPQIDQPATNPSWKPGTGVPISDDRELPLSHEWASFHDGWTAPRAAEGLPWLQASLEGGRKLARPR